MNVRGFGVALAAVAVLAIAGFALPQGGGTRGLVLSSAAALVLGIASVLVVGRISRRQHK